MRLLADALRLARKDLRIDLRNKEVLVSTTLFSVLVAVISALSFYLDTQSARRIAPGVLWVATTFAGLLAMGRSWSREREAAVIDAIWLSVAHPSAIYLGKVLSTWTLLLVVEVVLVPWVALLFHVALASPALELSLLIVSGTLGFMAAGNLFGAMTVTTRARDLLLSVVLFPLVAPSLLAAVVASREVFNHAPFSETLAWLRILWAFNLVFLTAGTLLFPAVFRDGGAAS